MVRGPGFLSPGLAALAGFATLTAFVRDAWPAQVLACGAFLLAAAWALRALIRPRPIRGAPLVALVAATAVWPAVQLAAATTINRHATWNAALHWGACAAVTLIAAEVMGEPRVRERWLTGWVWFAFTVSLMAVVEYHTSQGDVFWLFASGYPDAWGPFSNRNHFAAFVELAFPAALWKALAGRRIYFGVAATLAAASMASASRAGALLILAEMVAVTALCGWRWRRAAVVVSMAAALTLLTGWHTLAARLAEPDPYRREILASTLRMAAARPWTGFGLGTFATVYPEFARFDAGAVVEHAHNDWAEWTAEGGVLFLLLMAVLVARALRPAVRSAWGVGVVAVYFHALVDYPFARLGVSVWVFILMAALESMRAAHLRKPGQVDH